MRFPLGSITGILLVLSLVSFYPTAAEAQLGTSTWSVEIATDIGTGDNDVSFAIRRHTNPHTAFRFGVEVDVSDFDGDGVRTTTGTADRDVEQVSASNELGLSIQWMRFAPIRENLSATFAMGPFVRTDRILFRSSTARGLATFSEFEFRNNETTFGWDLHLGAEWFFSKRFSLGGTTGIRAELGSAESVDIQRSGTGVTYSVDETDVDSDIARITTGTNRIQLTAYF